MNYECLDEVLVDEDNSKVTGDAVVFGPNGLNFFVGNNFVVVVTYNVNIFGIWYCNYGGIMLVLGKMLSVCRKKCTEIFPVCFLQNE